MSNSKCINTALLQAHALNNRVPGYGYGHSFFLWDRKQKGRAAAAERAESTTLAKEVKQAKHRVRPETQPKVGAVGNKAEPLLSLASQSPKEGLDLKIMPEMANRCGGKERDSRLLLCLHWKGLGRTEED